MALRTVAVFAIAPLIGASFTAAQTVPVSMVVTVEPIKDGDSVGEPLKREDVMVYQEKDRLQVTAWAPARGEQGGLQLFILIDEACGPSLGPRLDELRSFILAQRAGTYVAIGYMQNGGVMNAQNFTSDYAQAAKALRLPAGVAGKYDTPYQPLIKLMKSWRDKGKMRREVLLITDGIDRATGSNSKAARWSNRAAVRDMPYTSPDVDTAIEDAQRTGVIVHAIYARSLGRVSRNYYEADNGWKGMAKVADETGGEAFFDGLQSDVAYRPYFDRLRSILDNQYFLEFQAKPNKKPELQDVKITTEIPKVEIVSAAGFWAGPKQPAQAK